MSITIRELRGTDMSPRFLETLAGLAEVRLTLAEAREIFRLRLRDNVLTYVALVDEKLAGTATLLLEQKFIHHGGRVGHVEDVAVHRDCRQQGVGAALVRHATREAKRLGCYKVILNCYEQLVPFYQGLGYRVHDCGMRIDLAEDGQACISGSSATPTAAIAQ